MSNATKRGYHNIHGVNPQALIEKVIRSRIYDSLYWKEHCFALSADTLIDKAVAMTSIGGVYANQRPTEFLCLTLKLLQLQPEKEILMEYLTAEEFKYLRALAVFYIRLTFRPVEVYEILEPLLRDYRKVRFRDESGYSILHFDEFVDQLLTEDRVCDVILPRLTQRAVLEETEGLGPRTSALDGALDGGEGKGKGREGDEDVDMRSDGSRSPAPSRGRSRSRSRSRSPGSSAGSEGRFISRSPSPRRSRSRSRSASSDSAASWRSRSRSVSPDRLERMMAEAVGEGRWRAAAGSGSQGAASEAGSIGEDRVEGDV